MAEKTAKKILKRTTQEADSVWGWLKEIDPQLIGLLVAIIVILITTFVILAIRRRIKRQALLLVGMSESGKTLLFSQLTHEKHVDSFTSMKENTGFYTCHKKGTLTVHDIPGNERLASRFFNQFKATCRGLVFVVDSVTFQKKVKDVAELLYTILTDSDVASNSIPVLVFCNKQDLTMAKGCQVIKSMLEKEINMLRVTKASQLQSMGESANNNTFLGKRGKDFEFAHVLPIKVEFEEGSAGKELDIDSLKNWVAKVV